jgi:hypothetical protein
MSTAPFGRVPHGHAGLYGSDDRSRERSDRAANRPTPTADTSEPGYRRTSAEQRTDSAHATDGAGCCERILQAGGHGFESPWLHQANTPSKITGRCARAINVPLACPGQCSGRAVVVIVRAVTGRCESPRCACRVRRRWPDPLLLSGAGRSSRRGHCRDPCGP